jgi:5-methylcytosine-specific restriction endonuclease McrA
MILEAKNLVKQHFGEDVFVYRGGHNHEGVQSQLKTSSIILVDGAPKTRRYTEPALTNQALFARDRNTCAYCGRFYRVSELTRDHIHPQSRGGKDKWTNCVTACKSCNNLKDDLMPGAKLPGNLFSPQGTKTMDPLYVPFVPCKAEAMILKSRNIRADQMEFLASKIINEKSRVLRDWREGRFYCEG